MNKMYEVRLVEMDEEFNSSVSDEVSGRFRTLSVAKKEYAKWLKNLKKNPPEYNCYLCIEVFDCSDYGEEFPEWQDQIMYKEIVNHTSERV